MRLGVGYQETPITYPILFNSIEVVSIDAAIQWVNENHQAAEIIPFTQIQDELVKQGWTRIANTITDEIFLIA